MTPTHLDAAAEAYRTDVLAAIAEEVGVLDSFVLGSGLIGGYRPGESDLDLVVVVDAPLGGEGRRRWKELFAPIPPERIREAMKESLDWARRRAPDDEFARVHAERARHYLAHGTWITKKEAKE